MTPFFGALYHHGCYTGPYTRPRAETRAHLQCTDAGTCSSPRAGPRLPVPGARGTLLSMAPCMQLSAAHARSPVLLAWQEAGQGVQHRGAAVEECCTGERFLEGGDRPHPQSHCVELPATSLQQTWQKPMVFCVLRRT